MPREHKIQIIERYKVIPGRKNPKVFYYARITWMEGGKRKALWRSGSNKTEARDRLRDALREKESLAISGKYDPRAKFSTVLKWYLDRYAVAPIYVESRKISGLRSADSVRASAEVLREYFGDQHLGAITHADLETFKGNRLQTPTIRKKQRAIASVHRELALLRRIFNISEREGWIIRSPFRKGDTLISPAHERKGTRILSIEEEVKLLAQCTGPRAHLKAILICALDTGMRAGEIFSLRWKDIDEHITLPALNTKTIESRTVPISSRLKAEFNELWEKSEQVDDKRVFQVKSIRRAFKEACRLAKIEHGDPHGLTLRVFRRTRATRWIQQGLSGEEVSKLLGHAGQGQYGASDTTYRHYVAADQRTLDRAKELLDKSA